MQHSPNSYFYLLVAAVFLFITWLGYRLLTRWHEGYRRKGIAYGYWLVSITALLVMSASRTFRPVNGELSFYLQVLIYAVYAWVMGLIVLLPVMFGLYCVRFVLRKIRAKQQSVRPVSQEDGSPINRRDFLRGVTAAAPLASLAISSGGVFVGDNYITQQRLTLSFANLPEQLTNYKIAQISDTHIGPFFGMGKLDRVLTMIDQEKPDLLVITGDLIDDLSLLTPTMERINRFFPTVPQGIYYCWGNHEYFRNIAAIREAWKQSPVFVLENNNRKVVDGKRPFYLLGVDYPWADKKEDQQTKRRGFINRALSGVPEEAFRLLIAHHPDFFDNSFENNIPLTLAGHTHGGQVALFGKSLLPVQYKYMRGLYQQNGNYGYVSVGTGHWMPFRIGCPAEVTFFTLKPASPVLSAKI